jgi:hypothetical protein
MTGEDTELKEGVFLLVKLVFKGVGMDTQWLFTKKKIPRRTVFWFGIDKILQPYRTYRMTRFCITLMCTRIKTRVQFGRRCIFPAQTTSS